MSRRRINSDEEEDDGDGDSMREEDRPKRKRISTKASLAEGGDDDDGDDSDGYTPGQRSSSKDKKGRKTKRKDESEEEEDASLPTDDFAEDDWDSDGSVYKDKYDDNMYIDEADRKYMESLTEKEREVEFAKRYEERERDMSRWEITRKMKKESRAPGRRSNKEREKQSKIIGELKEKRLQKEKKDKEGESRRVKERAARDARLEHDSDLYQDDEDALQALEEEEMETEDSRPANFEQIQSIRLSRNRLELWCCEPFFADVITGCFVRIGIGLHNNSQVYRLCQITGVKEGQTYAFGRTRTHFRLLLKHGPSERLFRMEMISNQPFSQSEYERWKKEVKDNNLQIPSMSFVAEKAADVEAKRHYEHKPEDIKYIVALKKKLGIASINPVREKEAIKRQIDLARDGQGPAGVDIEALEEKIVEIDEASRTRAAKMHSDISGISMVNQRNKHIDASKLDLNAKADAAEDVFTRKKTIPVLSNSKKASDKAQPAEAPKAAAPRDNVDDFYEAHNVHLDIDHLLPPIGELSSLPPLLPAPVVTAHVPGSSRLSLDEYNRRRGL